MRDTGRRWWWVGGGGILDERQVGNQPKKVGNPDIKRRERHNDGNGNNMGMETV